MIILPFQNTVRFGPYGNWRDCTSIKYLFPNLSPFFVTRQTCGNEFGIWLHSKMIGWWQQASAYTVSIFVAVSALTQNAFSTNWTCMHTHTHTHIPVHVLTKMTVFLPQYLTTYLSVFLPLLTAPLICHSTTLQLYNYRTSHTGEGNKQHVRTCATEDIYKISECVPVRIYATRQDVCHWGYIQIIRMCVTEDATPHVVRIHLMLGHTKNT